MKYKDAISQLQTMAIKKGIDYRLEHLQKPLQALGNPQHALNRSIHVAGTNGKGSTVAFLSAIFQEAGLRVGTFTSPHLESYTERIAINAKPIATTTFTALFEQCAQAMTHGLTEFETLTLMALVHFKNEHPDICIFEVGLGGRLDATNIIQPSCSVITQIDYDHQAILGQTLTEIAGEKAGIIKKNTPVITTTTQAQESLDVIYNVANKHQVPVYTQDPIAVQKDWQLQGAHQGVNASLAVKAAKLVVPTVTAQQIKQGLKTAMIWGRFSQCEYNNQTLIIDGAHNDQGLRLLQTNLANLTSWATCKIQPVVFGIHRSKDLETLIPKIKALGNTFYYCNFDADFAYPLSSIVPYFDEELKAISLNDALPNNDMVVITGSLYLIGNLYAKICRNWAYKVSIIS
jgi:dihydrofolate synthase/folylpolyglutamate synthase